MGAVVVLPLLLASCAGGGPPTTSGSASPASDITAAPESSLPLVAPTLVPHVSPADVERLDPPPLCLAARRTVTVEGHEVIEVTPTSASPVAVLIALHGYKESPTRLAGFSELDTLAAAGLAIVAYPAGTPLDLGYGWNSGAGRFATRGVDDAGLLTSVLDHLLGVGCADASRVYLAGESNGGGMALRAACDPRLSGRLAGVVLVNPAIDDGVLNACGQMIGPLEVLAAVGQADRVIPTDGSRAPFLSIGDWFPIVARHLAACDDISRSLLTVADRVSVVSGVDCGECAATFSSADGGHTWPGAREALNGAPVGAFALTEHLARSLAARVKICDVGSAAFNGGGES